MRASGGGRRARGAAVAAVAALALVASACGGGEGGAGGAADTDGSPVVATEANVNLVTGAGEPEAGGRLRYGLLSETDGWNPTLSRWGPSGLTVARSVFDLMVVLDADGGWQPELVESFTPSADFTSWAVRPRPGTTFHDGSPLDAEAVAEYLRLLQASPLTGLTMRPVTGIEVVDGAAVIRLDRPWTTLPYAFATQIGALAEPTWLATGSPTDPVGAGPFAFRTWDPGESLLVARNDAYWREGFPLLDEVEFVPISDALERTQALEGGDVDAMQAASLGQLDDLRTLAGEGRVQLACGEGSETAETFVMLNLAAQPTADPEVRRALVLATDPVQVATEPGDPLASQVRVARGPYSEGSRWYVETDYPEPDPDAAAELVAAIEARTGAPLVIQLTSVGTTDSNRAVQELARQWGEAGIDVEVASFDQPIMIRNVLFGDYQAVLWQQFDAPHPLMESIFWHPLGAPDPPPAPALNFARNDDPVIGQLLDDVLDAPDQAAQEEGYAAVFRQLNADMPYVWLQHGQLCVAADTDVVDLVTWTTASGAPGLQLLGGSHPLWQVWLDR